MSQSASFALKDIVNECDLSAYAEQIVLTCEEGLRIGIQTNQQNYQVRLMSIIGLCLSDWLRGAEQGQQQRCIDWMYGLVEPYFQKLSEMAQLVQTDKSTQLLTCHIINLMSQLMLSLVQRQKRNNELLDDSTAVGSANNSTFLSSVGDTNANGSFGSQKILNDHANASIDSQGTSSRVSLFF